MMTKTELLAWLNALPADAQIGVDEGGLSLCVQDSEAYLELGGIPENEYPDDEDPWVKHCGREYRVPSEILQHRAIADCTDEDSTLPMFTVDEECDVRVVLVVDHPSPNERQSPGAPRFTVLLTGEHPHTHFWSGEVVDAAIRNLIEAYHQILRQENTVVIEVTGGVAEITKRPDNLAITIIDHDNS